MMLGIVSVITSLLMASPAMGEDDGAHPVVFAVIGDYGLADDPLHPGAEAAVAAMVLGWDPAFIVTVGDNFYPGPGPFKRMDANVVQFYHKFIHPYHGAYGDGSPDGVNRFFPALGNHDVDDDCEPYSTYFAGLPEGVPGNKRFYSFTWGDVPGEPGRPLMQFFCINANDPSNNPFYRCPSDGITADSPQGQWLERGLADSKAVWNVVYMHQPPYSSATPEPADGHGCNPALQWPYQKWGADIVLCGHEHFYERLSITDDTQHEFPYIVNGLGGAEYIATFNPDGPIPGSLVRFDANYGAMRATASPESLTFEFWDCGWTPPDTPRENPRQIDRLELRKDGPRTDPAPREFRRGRDRPSQDSHLGLGPGEGRLGPGLDLLGAQFLDPTDQGP